jgi:hypothetical protein
MCLNMNNGVCDLCTWDLVEQDSTCALCHGVDGEHKSSSDPDRMGKMIAFFGRTWEELEVTDEENDLRGHLRVTLPRSPMVNPVFDWDELPDEKLRRRPMYSVEADGTIFVSKATVVHAWCAMCVTQLSPADENWTSTLSPMVFPSHETVHSETHGKFNVGTMTPCFNGHSCSFCNKKDGYVVYCLFHMSAGKRRGKGCNKRMCSKDDGFFHPSCATLSGKMQRRVRFKGSTINYGMACKGNPKFMSETISQGKTNQKRKANEQWARSVLGINDLMLTAYKKMDQGGKEEMDELEVMEARSPSP